MKLSQIVFANCIAAQRPSNSPLDAFSGWSPIGRRVAEDRRYVDNWSLLLDIGILLKTFKRVLGAKGAY
jgi:lipopolysaccharide/colanic/teichoic acid biosynthesis glycosyltransferase